MKLGNLEIGGHTVLAPMAGVTDYAFRTVCDRCAAAFVRPVEYSIEAVLVTGMESDDFENPWVFELVENCADLDDIITTAFVLNMDQKLLCREDCKGLCCRCGKNLNEGACDCRPEPDSRFAVLQQLLDKKK